jgi:hypothetical protein
MVHVPTHPAILRPHASMDHRYNSSFFNSEFKFLLIHESNFNVTGFSYGPTTRDAMGRVSRSRAAYDVAAADTSMWILGATAFRWILATTAIQARVPRLLPQLLAPDTGRRRRGHLQQEGKPIVGNASMDDTDATAIATFFFATDDKSFVPTFNCSICNTSKCRTSRFLIHLCLQTSFIGLTRLHQLGPKHGQT